MSNQPAKGINIIRHRGEPNKAEFMGQTVTRQERILITEWMAFVAVTHYDDHFIFEVPMINGQEMPGPAHMCTCGSPAVVKDHEAVTRLFVCQIYETYGSHQTSFVDKKDFKKTAGAGKSITAKGRKWLT